MNIKCTERQAYMIELALETLTRMCCGQLHHMVEGIESLRRKEFNVMCPDGEERSFYSLGIYIEKMIKPILFPELHTNASYGVGNKEIGDAQIAYEMVKILQNHRSVNHKEDCFCVMHYKPLHYSKEPLIEINDEVDNEKK